MPLSKGKSEKAVEKNIKTEVAAGKPVKQSVAIALNTQREAKKKDKKEWRDLLKGFAPRRPRIPSSR